MERTAKPADAQGRRPSAAPGTDGGSAPPSPTDGDGFAIADPPDPGGFATAAVTQAVATAGPAYGPPIKRSVMIAGHMTSISLEPIFWAALSTAAGELQKPVSALVAEIDAARLDARPHRSRQRAH